MKEKYLLRNPCEKKKIVKTIEKLQTAHRGQLSSIKM